MKTAKEQRHAQLSTPRNKNAKKRTWLFPTLLVGVVSLLVALAALLALTTPALASISSLISPPAPTQEIFWAHVDIAKPSIPKINVSVPAASLSSPTNSPGLSETETSTFMSEATETPGTLVMEIVSDDSMRQSVAIDNAQVQYSGEGQDERWIDVNLSEQRVYAYEGDNVVNSFLVSTGVAETPTVTGTYKIWIKVPIQDMYGPGYYLPDVPYVMYFYEDYGLHGTYWHNNFGTPMSRGCVNLTVDDAAWLFDWASVGTVVNVHD